MAGDATNLTGVWLGLYSYPRHLEPVSFGATLIETQSWLSGSIHEPSRFDGAILFATILGQRNGGAISFVKTYDAPARGYSAPVTYEGTIGVDACEIEGRWIIRASWSGRFLMVRSGRNAEARARKKFAQVE